MSILVKGVEMPETCKLCYLSEFEPGFYAYVCKPTGIRIDYDMAKIDRPRTICPLVPVPPHGRLVAMDEIEERIDSCCDDIDCSKTMCNKCAVQIVMGKVFDAPTIIPAEEGET